MTLQFNSIFSCIGMRSLIKKSYTFIVSRIPFPLLSKRIPEHRETASGPLTLMIPIPDSESAVEIAAIVVDEISLIIYKSGPQQQPWPNRHSETVRHAVSLTDMRHKMP